MNKMILYIVLLFSIEIQISFQVCNGPLGMINGDIRDWQITASSTYPNVDCHEKNARLYQTFNRAWCARYKSDSEWLQIDLGIAAKISGVLTQGRSNREEYVRSFMISFSIDAYRWQYLVDQYGNQKIFLGNQDSFSIRNNYFNEPILARFIKFHPLKWYSHPSLRVEIIGCQECKQSLGLPPYGKLRASTTWPSRRRALCQATDGYLMSRKAWCSKKRYQNNQWLEFDIGHPALITTLITKGRADRRADQWVTKYKISFSNDTLLWIYYKEQSQFEPKEFAGNTDHDSERIHFLNEPFFARYIRFYPIEWHNHVSMRVDILGCPHQGVCLPGYFRVNDEAQCIENLAYRKSTWMSDRYLYYKKYGSNRLMLQNFQKTNDDSALAVDGGVEKSTCTMISNYLVEKPIWMVDLGRRIKIGGIVLQTWQEKHLSNSSISIYRDNMKNFDRFNIYIDNMPYRTNFSSQKFCSSLIRTEQFSRLHIQCQSSLNGRFVYIESLGITNQWNRYFTIALCEVFVYEE